MDLFSLRHLSNLCKRYGLLPSKTYGQHFLVSEAPIRDMIAAGELEKGDTVVEVGPGFGVLTMATAPRVQKVLAFEIERKLKPYWEEKQKEFPNVELVWGNALTKVKSQMSDVKCQYKVLANLPYQITSEVIRLFLEAENKPERLVLMAQKEVAERICARPPDMNLLAVSAQYYGEPKIVRIVPRGCFWPAPKVDSAVIAIMTKERRDERTRLAGGRAEELVDDELFFRAARAGFARKRRQLWRNLASGLHLDAAAVKRAVREAAGNETVRSEELGVAQWIQIINKLFGG